MKLNMKYIILYVNDLEASLHFYRDLLGLSIKMQVDTYVEFETGATTLSLNTRTSVNELLNLGLTADMSATSTFEIGFVTEDVHGTMEQLRQQGVPIVREPETKPWGQTVAYVTDPDGHLVEICTAVG
ncbi:VOC family protein [Paenibacillus campi]|uniref:VOC family protein n=1 Tax=Paenibacillus campi TaxID=3106031 RepID=UPI002AFEA7C5|nr:VOC family protein [Paenibacillus sp. SGZ-1009]